MPYAYRAPIRVWDSKTIPYAYGTSHTRTGQNTHIVQNNAMLESKVSVTLEHLNIIHNNVGEETMKLILKSLRYKNTLEFLTTPKMY